MAKVLIVDDEVLIAPLLSECLGRLGHETQIARSAVGALGWLDLDGFDIAILDVMMAGPLDGLDLCRAIRSDPQKAKCKILVISGVPDMEHNALTAGADAFLAKPFDLIEIITGVANLLEVNGGGRSLGSRYPVGNPVHSYNA